MANTTVGKVWVLDTTGVIKAKGIPVYIKYICWTGTTATNVLEIRDGNEMTIIKATANTYQLEFFWRIDEFFDGLDLQTLGGGSLYICIG